MQQPPPMVPRPYPDLPDNYSPTVTIGDWLIYVILQMIPFVNIVSLIIFARDSSKPSRANLAKLNLICLLVFIIFIILICVVAGSGFDRVIREVTANR